METYESDADLVASIDDKRMIGRVVLWVEIDPYSRLIVKIAARWTRVRHLSKSTAGQLSEIVNTDRARLKDCEVDHSVHDIHVISPSRRTLRHIFPRRYRRTQRRLRRS